MRYNLSLMLIVIVEAGLLASTVYILGRLWTKNSWLRRVAQNFAILFFTLLVVLTFVEIFFAFFFIQSDGINFTLASQRWHERYWKPINSIGYRDYEWQPEDLADRTTIIVTGDSFVAGWGIADAEDRFSNQLGELLSDDYAVMTVAQNGWGLSNELDALENYPHSSDIIILSHYVNDIIPSGDAVNFPGLGDLFLPPKGRLKLLIDNSHMINYVYWRLYRWHAYDNPLNRREVKTYQNYLRELFADPDVWQQHTLALRSIYDWSESHDKTLIVVVFPDMLWVEDKIDAESKVINFYRDLGIPVVDIAELVKDMPAQDRIVNVVDTHASVEVQSRTAKALESIVRALDQ